MAGNGEHVADRRQFAVQIQEDAASQIKCVGGLYVAQEP